MPQHQVAKHKNLHTCLILGKKLLIKCGKIGKTICNKIIDCCNDICNANLLAEFEVCNDNLFAEMTFVMTFYLLELNYMEISACWSCFFNVFFCVQYCRKWKLRKLHGHLPCQHTCLLISVMLWLRALEHLVAPRSVTMSLVPKLWMITFILTCLTHKSVIIIGHGEWQIGRASCRERV